MLVRYADISISVGFRAILERIWNGKCIESIHNSFIMRLHSNTFCILFSAVDKRQGTDVGNDEPNMVREFFASVQYPRNLFFIRHFSISVGHAFQLPRCWSTFCYYFLTGNFECAFSFFHTIASILSHSRRSLSLCLYYYCCAFIWGWHNSVVWKELETFQLTKLLKLKWKQTAHQVFSLFSAFDLIRPCPECLFK